MVAARVGQPEIVSYLLPTCSDIDDTDSVKYFFVFPFFLSLLQFASKVISRMYTCKNLDVN